MTAEPTFLVDGVELPVLPGRTILEAAEAAGVYVPRLCHYPGLPAVGACRVCTVRANGRLAAACIQPVAPGMVVENDTDELNGLRRAIVEMLFSEGNHYCPSCEKSGQCELQATAYRLGMTASRYPHVCPSREVDASHPDVWIDHDRCILCGRCVRASREVDGKGIFGFAGRGKDRRIVVDADGRLADSAAAGADRAAEVCPTGALLRKGGAFRDPVGRRRYDAGPIGADVEARGGKEDA